MPTIKPTDVGSLDRTTYIGSSDIAAVLGLSPWRTPLDVFFEKMGEIRPPDPDREKLFRRGKRLEPVILDMLADELGIQITARGRRYRSAAHRFLAAEIDGEYEHAGETINVEIKTAHPFASAQWGESDTDEIPIHYAAQAAFALAVTGRARCVVAVLFGADNLVTYRLERDDETIAGIIDRAVRFWRHNVEKKIPPDPIKIDDLMRLFRRDVDTIVEADEPTARLLEQYNEARAEARAAANFADELKFHIGKYMVGAKTMQAPTKTPRHVLNVNGVPALTIAYQEQRRIDTDALRKKYPEIAVECSTTSGFFRFSTPRKRIAK